MRVCGTQCSCELLTLALTLMAYFLHAQSESAKLRASTFNIQFQPLLGSRFKRLTPTRQAPGRTFSIDLRACCRDLPGVS